MTSAPSSPAKPHECFFPFQTPGALGRPGACECGKTYDQQQVDDAYKRVCAAAAAAYPLPDVDYASAIAADWHAVRRADAMQQVAWHGREPAVIAVCGRTAVLARAWPLFGGEVRPASCEPCPECAWAVAAERGDLEGQLGSLDPSAADGRVLARLLPEPLIALTAAAGLVEAAVSGFGGRDPDDPALIQMLAAITRHRPLVTLPEECAEGSCEHGAGGRDPGPGRPRACPMPEASVVCRTCSLQAGSWAGEWKGQLFAECTIPAPCGVLTALATHAAAALGDARRARELHETAGASRIRSGEGDGR